MNTLFPYFLGLMSIGFAAASGVSFSTRQLNRNVFHEHNLARKNTRDCALELACALVAMAGAIVLTANK
jgi:hypothetical protein